MPSVWAVTGVEIPASGARSLAYVASSGAMGVAAPGDLKVSTLTTPGPAVLVAQGGGLIPSRYPTAAEQTYASFSPSSEQVPVTATGGAARNDLVVVRVRDKDYEGSGVVAGATYETIQGVASTVIANPSAAAAYCRNLSYPALPLAGLALPANTATVQASMITDLRALANPRSQGEVFMTRPGACSDVSAASGTGFVTFPAWTPSVVVPSWATHATVIATATSVYQIVGGMIGYFRTRMGSLIGSEFPIDTSMKLAPNDPDTTTLVAFARADCRALAGTTQTLNLEARWASGGGGLRWIAGQSGLMFDVRFEERAV